MKYKNITIPVLVLGSIEAFSQTSSEVEMADILRQDGKIYTVVAGLVVILTAMIILLIRVDRRISKMEKKLPQNHNS
jgi:hypothetical protein